MSAIIQKPKFSAAIQSDGYKKLINSTLSDPKRSQRFVASVSSAVATNPALQECDAGSILSAALLGEALNLAMSPQLGHFYLVPYKKKARTDRNGNVIEPEKTIAQFQMGYKGYCQLAMRSGFYKRINVVDIRQGELIKFDLLNEEIQVAMVDDDEERDTLPVIGYYAMFEYLNGFRKEIFWTKKKMLNHADKYSQAFDKNVYDAISNGRIQKLPKGKKPKEGFVSSDDLWKYSSFWYKSFDEMAFKTMLRHILSRWGIMSIEMTEAFSKDMAEIKDTGNADFIDSDSYSVGDVSSMDAVLQKIEEAENESDLNKIDFDVLTSDEKKIVRKSYKAKRDSFNQPPQAPINDQSVQAATPGQQLRNCMDENQLNAVYASFTEEQQEEWSELFIKMQAELQDPI